MTDTKVYIEFRVKGYPAGKRIRCHFWLEKDGYTQEEIEEYVCDNMSLTEYYKSYDIQEIKIYKGIRSNSKKPDEKFGDIIVDSEITLFQTVAKKEEEKKLPINLRTIKLDEYKTEDIEYLNKLIQDTLVMRKYDLTNDEYNFYVNNIGEIKIEEVKDVYEKCNGDIFKLRKNKIRDKLYS